MTSWEKGNGEVQLAYKATEVKRAGLKIPRCSGLCEEGGCFTSLESPRHLELFFGRELLNTLVPFFNGRIEVSLRGQHTHRERHMPSFRHCKKECLKCMCLLTFPS